MSGEHTAAWYILYGILYVSFAIAFLVTIIGITADRNKPRAGRRVAPLFPSFVAKKDDQRKMDEHQNGTNMASPQ